MSHSQLKVRERCSILILSQYGLNQTEIARRLGRQLSTISRKFKRNQSPHWAQYTDHYAQCEAESRRRKARHRRRLDHRPLWDFVMDRLRDLWLPDALPGRFAACFPQDGSMRIIAEPIYASIAADAVAGGTP